MIISRGGAGGGTVAREGYERLAFLDGALSTAQYDSVRHLRRLISQAVDKTLQVKGAAAEYHRRPGSISITSVDGISTEYRRFGEVSVIQGCAPKTQPQTGPRMQPRLKGGKADDGH